MCSSPALSFHFGGSVPTPTQMGGRPSLSLRRRLRLSAQAKGFGKDQPESNPEKISSKARKYEGMSQAQMEAALEEMERRKNGPTTQVVESSTERSAAAELVSTRILYRILAFAGLPTFSGILLLPLFYFLKVTKGVEIPMSAVYASQAVFVGAGLLGISYGALSASWDPMREGSLLGINEFQTNLPIIWSRIRKGQ